MLPPPGFVSPVPAKIVPFDAIAIAPIAWVMLSGHAAVKVAPESVLCHTPAVEVATYRPPFCLGSATASTTRPPTVLGPRNFHVAFASSGETRLVSARTAATWAAAARID